MTQHLFVYGTLAPGQPNEHILKAIGGTWQPATVKGHLKERGWGAGMGYPAIVLDEDGEDINGFLFSSDNLANHWDELDDFEGDEYKRVVVDVQSNDARLTEANIYVLRER